jgi:glycosyltransferase involved in cell wall biosynthesis
MKPRIFIDMHYMEIGGAERALLGLLNAIDTDRCDVDLFIHQHTGDFMPLIPKNINLLPEIPAYTTIERPISQIVKEGHVMIAAARILAKIRHSIYHRHLTQERQEKDDSIFQYVADCTTPFLPSLKGLGTYDLAISFLNPHNMVLEKVEAKRKIAWIHTDYSTIHVNTAIELPVWGGYDKIVSISTEASKAFVQSFPTLESKIVEIENILSPEFVRQQADTGEAAEYTKEDGVVKLCSVGRYSYAKNYDNVPRVAKILKEKGVKFQWYIIGYGDAAPILDAIKQTGTDDVVHLLGKKVNPYPYINACDIYLQPSRYEGKSVTVREAQMLCKPVIITDYPTAKSQVQDGVDGVIVKMDNESIAEGIARMINDNKLQTFIEQYLTTHDYGNEKEVEKLYKLIEE